MKKNKKDSSFVKKIVIDEKTNEPIIVDVPESEYLSEPIPKKDFVEAHSDKSVGKQIAMERVFGIKKQDDSINKRQKLFKQVTTLVFIVFMLGVLVYTAYQDFFTTSPDKQFPSIEKLKEIFCSGWMFLLLALVSLGLGFIFKSLKTSIMCKSLTKKAHFKTSLETAIIGTYYNNVTPLAVGGQPFEIYHLSKHGVHGGVAASIPIASFFLNQLGFVILTIISLILFKANIFNAPSNLMNAFPSTFYVLAIIGSFCCIFVPSLVILFCILPRLGAKLVYLVVKIGAKLRIVKDPNKTLQSTIKTVVHNSHCLKKIATKTIPFMLLMILSFLENIANVSIAFFTLKGFGMDISGLTFLQEWIIICMICFILFASVTFIPTPGNAGAADLSFFLLFECLMLPGLAFPAMITWRLFSFYSTLIIGFTFATLKKKADKKYALLHPNTQDTPTIEQEVEMPKNLVIPVIETEDDITE